MKKHVRELDQAPARESEHPLILVFTRACLTTKARIEDAD
jgi:hypothetical protein